MILNKQASKLPTQHKAFSLWRKFMTRSRANSQKWQAVGLRLTSANPVPKCAIFKWYKRCHGLLRGVLLTAVAGVHHQHPAPSKQTSPGSVCMCVLLLHHAVSEKQMGTAHFIWTPGSHRHPDNTRVEESQAWAPVLWETGRVCAEQSAWFVCVKD